MPTLVHHTRLIHDACAPQAGLFADDLPEAFLGKAVKVVFPALSPNAPFGSERMYVVIDRVVEGQLEGWLMNKPTFLRHVQQGSRIRVKIAEIIEWQTPPEGWIEKNRPR